MQIFLCAMVSKQRWRGTRVSKYPEQMAEAKGGDERTTMPHFVPLALPLAAVALVKQAEASKNGRAHALVLCMRCGPNA